MTSDVEEFYHFCQQAVIQGIAGGIFPNGSTIDLNQCDGRALALKDQNSSIMFFSWILGVLGSVYLLSTSYVRAMRERSDKERAQILSDLLDAKSQADQNTELIVEEVKRQARMEIIMGDKYENIANSTIINRSNLSKSMTAVEKTDPNLSRALGDLAALVADSGNVSAGKNLDALNLEIGSDKPDKHLLSTYWEGLQKILPTIKDAVGVLKRFPRQKKSAIAPVNNVA